MDMKSMMKQAQMLQNKMEEAKDEINNSKFTFEQGGAIKVVMFGTKKVSSVELDESILSDKEMVQDLIVVAINDCIKQIDEYTEEKMGALGPGLGGLF